MTKLLLVLSFALAACSGNAGPSSASGPAADTLRTYAATDSRIVPMGRYIATQRDAIEFAASGVTFYVKFQGRALDAEIGDELRWGNSYNWFSVVVDGGEPTRFRTEPGKTWYALASGLAPGVHTVALSKATEGQNGKNTLVAVRAERILQADPLPTRRIEVIGNSITAGYGLDSRDVACGKGTWFDQTHAWLAYGPRIARRLNAQWMLSSISGIGMTRNWNSPGPTMPKVYDGVYMDYADSTSAWDFSRYVPDLVMVALGTNDFSNGGGATPRPALDSVAFVGDYTGFLARVRQHYPRARFLLLNSPTLGDRKPQLARYLQRVADSRRAAGDSAVATFSYTGQWASGCSGHPDMQEQILMTDELEPVVKRLMGW